MKMLCQQGGLDRREIGKLIGVDYSCVSARKKEENLTDPGKSAGADWGNEPQRFDHNPNTNPIAAPRNDEQKRGPFRCTASGS